MLNFGLLLLCCIWPIQAMHLQYESEWAELINIIQTNERYYRKEDADKLIQFMPKEELDQTDK